MGKSSRGNEDENLLEYSSIQLNPNWSNFDILVEVAHVASKRLETEEKERKTRRNLSTFLTLLHEKETEESSKVNGSEYWDDNFQLPGEKIDVNFTKGTRISRKKSGCNNALLSKKLHSTKPQSDFQGNHILSKRSRSPNEEYPEKKPSNFKKSAKKPRNLDVPIISSSIPDEFRNRIVQVGGTEESITFLLQKKLSNTDVSPHFGRLMVRFGQIKNEVLTEEEENCFLGNSKFEIDAIFVDPELNEGRMKLKQWKIGYALITNWNEVVQNNQLTEGVTVELWAFRKDSQLGFALVKV